MFKFFKKFNFQIILLSAFFLLLMLVSDVFIESRLIDDLSEEYGKTSILREVNVISSEISLFLEKAESDLVLISLTPPNEGIIRAIENDGFDEQANSSLDQWYGRLQEIFVGLLEANDIYSQIRYIWEDGQELVRVNYIDGFQDIVVGDKLQNKSNRFYFQEIQDNIGFGVYKSYFDLNREGPNQTIQEPYSLVTRYSLPISDKSGEDRGYLFVNISLRTLFNKVANNVNDKDYVVIDSNGYYLYDINNPDKLYGSSRDLNTGENLINDFGEDVYQEIVRNDSGSVDIGGELILYSKVDNCTSRNVCLHILKITDDSSIVSGTTFGLAGSINQNILIYLILIFLLGFFINRKTKKLKNISENLYEASLGNETKHIFINDDELGQIGVKINELINKNKKLRGDIELEVEKETKKLEKEKELTKKQQKVVMSVLEDVKEEKERAEALKSRLEIAQRAADFGVWDWNIKKGKLVWDDVMRKIFRVSDDTEITYDFWAKFLIKEDLERIEKVFKESIKKFKDVNDNFRIEFDDGTIKYIKLDAKVVKNKKGEVERMIGVNYDITNEMEIDKAKSEFVSLASHQLRTPLSAIGWYTELLQDSSKRFNKQQTEFLQKIKDGKDRMAKLITALLNTTRLELGTVNIESKDVDLIKEIRSVLDEQKLNIDNKDIKVKTNLGDIDGVKSDPNLIRIILQNLISNAIKYNSDKGKLNIDLHKVEKEGEFGGRKIPKEMITISISDTGIGIPEGQRDEIFNKMFRADNVKVKDTEGNGLGLYLVKNTLKKLEGDIWFDSNKNGTTFYIILPLKSNAIVGKTKIEKDNE